MSVQTLYISASTNRQSHAACISPSLSLVLFGTHKLVGVWDASDNDDFGISQTIPGHTAEVSCVAWIEPDELFCSADQGGDLYVWKRQKGTWHVMTQIKAHERPISTLTCFGSRAIITGSSDSVLKVWSLDKESIVLAQNIELKNRFPLALAISTLPNSSALIMAVACTDRNIRIFTRSGDSSKFVSSLSLEGHEDWVRCLNFSQISNNPESAAPILTLASGSADGYIRLWAITASSDSAPASSPAANDTADELMDEFERTLGEMGEDGEDGGKSISTRAHIFSVGNATSVAQQYSLTFDALLVGHEAAVTSVVWQPTSGSSLSVPTLLSSSTDSSLILWSPSAISSSSDSTASLWTNRQRFGDVGGVKAGGFVGALWGSGGKEVLGWGWNGGWRRWRNISRETAARGEEWIEVGAIVGHAGSVRGLAWESEGRWLISTSLDQTARIHGSRIHPESKKETWHELARPQIHGYDLIAPTFVGANPYKFVSAADEKVARVFEAPKGFLKALQGLGTTIEGDVNARPVGAVVPPLGLSNKAIEGGGERDAAEAEVESADPAMYTRPPFEGELSALTLWPEVEKVFGHGYELITVASSPSGRLIATACKSTTPEHAVVRLYETGTWRAVGKPLAGHALTVTRIAFSPDEKFVLTVSRDRTWRMFELHADGGYVSVCYEKPHARIIWDCAWAHEGDGYIFATAARDKTVKIWRRDGEAAKWSALQTIKLKEGATALDFAPADNNGRRHLAIGLENGEVFVYGSDVQAPEKWEVDIALGHAFAHVDQVHRLAWRPSAEGGVRDLAMCSEDRSLRVVRVVRVL